MSASRSLARQVVRQYRWLFPILRARCARLLGNVPEAEEVAQDRLRRRVQRSATADPEAAPPPPHLRLILQELQRDTPDDTTTSPAPSAGPP